MVRIGICGNLASGKTTLARMLGNHYNVEPFYENIDRHYYLTDFYKDMKRWGFQSQVHFLARSLEQYNKMTETSGTIIQDGTIYEQELYTRNMYNQGIMESRDYLNYCLLFDNLVKVMKPPDKLIYLEFPLDIIMDRIHRRARACEIDVTLDYVKQLGDLYKNWIKHFKLCPVIDSFNDLKHLYKLCTTGDIAYYL